MTNLVTLRIGHQIYALPLDPVAQILELVTITPIPQADALLEGVIDVRGRAIPVIDLGRQLRHEVTPRDLHTPMLLLQSGPETASGQRQRMLAVLADEVLDVLVIAAGDLVNPDDVLPAGAVISPLLLGLARTGNGLVPVLNSEHLCEVSAFRELESQIEALPSEVPPVDALGVVSKEPACGSEQ